MTKLTVGKREMMIAELGIESSVPPIFKTENVQQRSKSCVDEEDGLYVGYGFIDDVFPYRKQNMYTRNQHLQELPTVELENDYLKAVFLPTLGARLWKLYDKKAGKELILTNDEIAFGNLALRDAWFCGGVEWNFGVIGHSPFTCAPVYTATLKTDDGTPVVRFYEYERIRGGTYQIDCWLPADSNRLFVGVRIVNTNEQLVVPTYWWSNIAVPEDPKARVITPATEAYVWGPEDSVVKKALQTEECDVTYPVRNQRACDHFFRTKEAPNKYIAYVDESGYGLCQASSSMQQGRKLFVWGQSNGADNWQRLLKTKSENGHYIEIQAGLGQTQYECIPMPPNSAWSWVESYGAIQVDPVQAHQPDYTKANACVDEVVAGYDMETALHNARHMTQPADTILFEGSGWGALEQQCREHRGVRPVSYHLQFTNCGTQQRQWQQLLQEGTLGLHSPDTVPESWMFTPYFNQLLEKAVLEKDTDNWYTHMHLGVVYHVDGRASEAESELRRSIALCDNAWAHYALACVLWKKKDRKGTIEEAVKCLHVKNNDVSLARAVAVIFSAAKAHDTIIEEVTQLPMQLQNDGDLTLSLAMAYLEMDQIEMAQKVTGDDPGFFAAYIREGNTAPTRYWLKLNTIKRERAGESTENLIQQIPLEWDFRMG